MSIVLTITEVNNVVVGLFHEWMCPFGSSIFDIKFLCCIYLPWFRHSEKGDNTSPPKCFAPDFQIGLKVANGLITNILRNHLIIFY